MKTQFATTVTIADLSDPMAFHKAPSDARHPRFTAGPAALGRLQESVTPAKSQGEAS